MAFIMQQEPGDHTILQGTFQAAEWPGCKGKISNALTANTWWEVHNHIHPRAVLQGLTSKMIYAGMSQCSRLKQKLCKRSCPHLQTHGEDFRPAHVVLLLE